MVAVTHAKLESKPLERVVLQTQLGSEERQGVDVSGHVIGQLVELSGVLRVVK